MIYFVAFILSLHFLPAAFSWFGLDFVFYALNELQTFLLCLAIYLFCPVRLWALKALSFINAVVSFAVFIHNMALEIGVMPEGISAVYSIALIGLGALVLCSPFLNHWARLPNDKIKPGHIYEIIGRPRNELQFLLFIINGGRGGSYAITDGAHIIKMSREHGQSILVNFKDDYLNGKKCVEIGGESSFNKKLFLAKIGVDFRLWRTCHWLSKGFKND